MSEVLSSLTELKIRIGKDIYLHGLEIAYRTTDAYWDDLDQVPDEFYIETADCWCAKCPGIIEKFSQAAEKALLEQPEAQGGATAILLAEMIKYATEMATAGLVAKAFYAFAIANGILGAEPTAARQYLEALVEYGRGE